MEKAKFVAMLLATLLMLPSCTDDNNNKGTPDNIGSVEDLDPSLRDDTDDDYDPDRYCRMTFVYTNPDTINEDGSSNHLGIYLVGDMTEWKNTDPKYKMDHYGNGTYKLGIDLDKSKNYKFKIYVDGWGSDSYRADQKKCVDGDCNNMVDATMCEQQINITEIPPECPVTFRYSNPYAKNSETDKPLDVYLVGTMNGWKPKDPNYKMKYLGDGAYSFNMNIVSTKTYDYKFYVDGFGDDSYRADFTKCIDEGCNNRVDATACDNFIYFNDYESDTCEVVVSYYNPWTSVESGGDKDYDVYLVGSWSDWKAEGKGFKLTPRGNGWHSVLLSMTKRSHFPYKFYVEGWGDDAYRADVNKCIDNDCNNELNSASCGSVVFRDIPAQNNNDNNGCMAKFIYSNPWTSKISGGTDDYDVYAVVKKEGSAGDGVKYKLTSDGNGTHSASIKLEWGNNYAYKYYVDGWKDDSYRSDPTKCIDDVCNNRLDLTNSCGQVAKYRDITCRLAAPPIVSGKNITFDITCADSSDAISSVSGGSGNATFSGMRVFDKVSENGKYAYNVNIGGNEIFVPVWVEDKPFNWRDAVIYYAFTDRFKDGDPSNNGPATHATETKSASARWKGGDFAGILQKVEEGYFEKLGVNTLWLSSVSMNTQGETGGNPSYSGFHSYWPITTFMTDENMEDFTSRKNAGVKLRPFEPHFGTEAELKALIDACHKRGIRVLLDFVANHVHEESPIYEMHKDWFNDQSTCEENADEKCNFAYNLPDLNYELPVVRNAMMDHVRWLIKRTNVDGFRVDAVKHMSPLFVKDLRMTTDELYANSDITFFLLGETFTGDVGIINKYIGDDMLHGQFDFPLYYALDYHVLKANNEADYRRVAELDVGFNSPLMGKFMDNHDVSRALSVAAGQNLESWGSVEEVTAEAPYQAYKTAMTVVMTNPGLPTLYYGDEIGMEGGNDPSNRNMMKFDKQLNKMQQGMLNFARQLGQIRKEHPVLARGVRENLWAEKGYWCYKVSDGNETIIVGVSRAFDGDSNKDCNLRGTYKLTNLLDSTEKAFKASSLDLSTDHIQIYLAEK